MSAAHITVPLYRAAHGRTGDKGNRSNISVIAWHPDLYPVLLAQVTEAVVARHFAHRRPARVQRFELPQLAALNFVLDEVLDGGVNVTPLSSFKPLFFTVISRLRSLPRSRLTSR